MRGAQVGEAAPLRRLRNAITKRGAGPRARDRALATGFSQGRNKAGENPAGAGGLVYYLQLKAALSVPSPPSAITATAAGIGAALMLAM